ncbi:hypothetical protein SAMN02787148_103279 [Burkholderia vietnamiensis]|nr:hypothetical protein SAMN02787148_103279 [Burkholderia vietnamiensis]SFX29302.1 hypothetical protein SAMN02787160_103278 [Burkholderia vietnamiensis]
MCGTAVGGRRLPPCPAPTAARPIGRPIRLCDNAHFPFPLRLTP